MQARLVSLMDELEVFICGKWALNFRFRVQRCGAYIYNVKLESEVAGISGNRAKMTSILRYFVKYTFNGLCFLCFGCIAITPENMEELQKVTKMLLKNYMEKLSCK